jgi:hypothetical protein
MRLVLLQAVCVSILVAVFFEVLGTLLFSHGMQYDPPVDPAWLSSLPAEQKAQWYKDHVRELGGLSILMSKFKSLATFSEFMKSTLFLFLPVCIASILTGLWLAKSVRSNPAALPPPLKIGVAGRAAFVALLLAVVFNALAFSISFYLDHGASTLEFALFLIIGWPLEVVMILLGESSMPEALYYTIAFAALFLYLWALVFLAMRAIAWRKHKVTIAL